MKRFLTITTPKLPSGRVSAYELTTLKDSLTGKEYSVNHQCHGTEMLILHWLEDNFKSFLITEEHLYKWGQDKMKIGSISVDRKCDWSYVLKIISTIGVQLNRITKNDLKKCKSELIEVIKTPTDL